VNLQPVDELVAAAGDYAEAGGRGNVYGKLGERLAAAYARVTSLAGCWSTPADIAAEAAEGLAYADTCVEAAKAVYAARWPSRKAAAAAEAGQLPIDAPDTLLGLQANAMEWRPDHL
jgi:hypothetical protein